MENAVELSVVVPVYNSAKYLPKCIDSILGQTYGNFEVILVDDGSNDSSGEICDNYNIKDSRVSVIHKKNAGAMAAVADGVAIANGKYIAFVGSVDWIENNMYEVMMPLSSGYGADCVMCTYKNVKEDGSISDIADMGISEGLYAGEDMNKFFYRMIPDLADKRYIGGTRINKIFKAELLKRLYKHCRKDIAISEDTYITHTALFSCASVYYVDKPLYAYLRRSDSITGTYKERYLEDWALSTSIYDGLTNILGGEERCSEAKFIFLEANVLNFIVRTRASLKQKSEWMKSAIADERVVRVAYALPPEKLKRNDKFLYDLIINRSGVMRYLLYRELRKIVYKLKNRLRIRK